MVLCGVCVLGEDGHSPSFSGSLAVGFLVLLEVVRLGIKVNF